MNNENRNSAVTVVCGLLYGAVLVAFSYLLGLGLQLLAFPKLELDNTSIRTQRFLMGTGVLFALYVFRTVIEIILRISHNRECKKLDSMMIMQTYNEFAVAGVRTPIDFCYLMLTTNYFMPINVFNGSPARLCQLRDIELYMKDVLVFKDMFGRNPMKADTFDWLSVTIYEIYVHNNKVEEDLTFEDLKKLVSPEVLSVPTRFNQEWSYEIQRQFKPKAQKLARELRARKKV